jgi:cobalt-zinc-cadmium efflux system membrane fusion protein
MGCNGEPKPKTAAELHAAHDEHKDGDQHNHATAGHDHSGWWCNEHGVPEEECALCSSKIAAEFQKKGDWCKEHDRPDSQCFKCHPELQEKFAAKYEAKFGKKPPELKMN